MFRSNFSGLQYEDAINITEKLDRNIGQILSYSTGCGKTRVSLLVGILRKKTVLCVLPKSLISSWFHELEDVFENNYEAHIYDGELENRKNTFKEFIGKEKENTKFIFISYHLLYRDIDFLLKYKNLFTTIILDEIHLYLRNENNKIYQALKKFSTVKLGLSATLCVNKKEDIINILKIIDPNSPYIKRFNYEFINKRHIVYRDKKSMNLNHIHVNVRDIYVSLTKHEKVAYRDQLIEVNKAFRRVINSKKLAPNDPLRRIAHINYQIQLQKLKIVTCLYNLTPIKKKIKNLETKEEKDEFLRNVESGSKLKCIFEPIRIFQNKKRPLLIFCDFIIPLEIIKAKLHDIPILTFHGEMTRKQRDEVLESWNDTEQEYYILCLSTNCGGVGLNLQKASDIILISTPWNDSSFEQIVGRVNRIGQVSENIQITRIVVAGTFDAIRFTNHLSKKQIQDNVLKKTKNDDEIFSIYNTIQHFDKVYEKFEKKKSDSFSSYEKDFYEKLMVSKKRKREK
jgi:SNF2 family DNA or RNA helicase